MHVLVQTKRELSLRFPSLLSEVDQACDVIQKFLDDQDCTQDQFFILLSLREALTNAVIHGNRRNPDLHITCSIDVHDGRLQMVIRDQGPGFAWRSHSWTLPDPESESGRGLTIMQSCFETVSFNEAGNEITLSKKIGTCSAHTGHDHGPAADSGFRQNDES